MKELFATTLVLASLCLSTTAFGQSSNATVSGTVRDATGAIIPGVTIKASNNATGVVTTVLTNEAGVYNFASLLPGTYTINAESSGFQTQTYTDVRLGNAAQVRLNFTLQVGTVSTAVEVSVSAAQVLVESSSSVGAVLNERDVQTLPLVNNNTLDLVKVMSGIVVTDSPVFLAESTTFGGVSARDINVQRDGISVKDQRFPTGINSATTLHPDLVGEVKVILAAVDAELGRGNGQVQIQTRSGTNEFHGAAVWSVQNSKLDANTWQNNRTGATPDWRNRHQGTVSVGGPIVRNKNHFFVLYDQAWARTRTTFAPVVLTPCARRGIFRYFDNWNNGNVNQVTTNSGTTPTIAVVDFAGNPKTPATNPNGTLYTGTLRYISVFGPLLNTPTQSDCSDARVGGPAWDPNRTQVDPTGFVNTTLKYMPAANGFDLGDGLNTAVGRWVRRLNGTDNLFGIGEDSLRKQINVRTDQIFSVRHKASAAYSYQIDTADDQWMTWPNTFQGRAEKRPQVLTFNFTSTLSPSLVNEARFGMSRTGTNTYMPLDNPVTGDQLRTLLPKVNGLTVAPGLGAGAVNFQLQNIIGSRTFGSTTGGPVTNRDSSPRYTYADTVSLTRGRHTFKFGAEHRIANTKSIQGGVFGGGNVTPFAAGGETTLAPVTGINSTNMPTLAGTDITGSRSAARDLLNFLSGSLVNVNQFRFINSPQQAGKAWNDPANDLFKIRDIHQNEFGAFFKDDWKVADKVTLNLGLRWDFYGVPYEENGLTGALEGGGGAIFGASGRSFQDWMRPGLRAGLTNLIFVGPNSPNPNGKVYSRDWNNFGPAVGFAWNATRNTTVRGGYQIAYVGGGRGNTFDGIIGNPPGSTAFALFTGDSNNPYLDLTDLPAAVPVQPTFLPLAPVPIESRQQSLTVFDPNYVNPYVQDLTLAVTHNVRKNVTVDLRYVGTLTRKNYGQININVPNFLDNGLKEAFDAARAGGQSDLLNRMFQGINFGSGVVDGVTVTGADVLRTTTTFRTNLANGNYQGLANTISTLNYNRNLAGNAILPFVPNGVNGAVLRYNGFPENFIKTNPQFNNATIETNAGYSNYHSMQAQLTLRPTYGVTLQGTYTWSKNLGVAGTFTDPRNRSLDYTLLGSDRQHVFRTFGSFDLPVGPNKLLAGNSSGALARVIEGWQTSWVVNLVSGSPATVSGNTTMYANGVPDLVAPIDLQNFAGVVWKEGAVSGNYFGNAFVKVPDPQCSAIAQVLQSSCSLNAIAEAGTNKIVLQNAKPGTQGNLGQNSFTNAGTWSADMAISKRLLVREQLRLQFRLDATNIFNHPTPGISLGQITGPIRGGSNLNLQGGMPFGEIPLKGPGGARGSRTDDVRYFQLQLRVEF